MTKSNPVKSPGETLANLYAVSCVDRKTLPKQNRKHDSEVLFYMHFYVGLTYNIQFIFLTINTHCAHTRNEPVKSY